MKLLNIDDLRKISTLKPGERLIERVVGEPERSKRVQVTVHVVPPEAEVEAYHYHKDTEQIMLILSGQGKEIDEGKEYSLKPNDLFYLPVNEKHTIQNTGKTDLKYLSINICADSKAPRDFVKV